MSNCVLCKDCVHWKKESDMVARDGRGFGYCRAIPSDPIGETHHLALVTEEPCVSTYLITRPLFGCVLGKE